MAFRVSFFFTQQGDLLSGGSVNFWNTSADGSTVAAAATAMQAALSDVTGNGNNFPNVRISDLDAFRAVSILRFNPTTVAQGNDTDADFVNTAGLLVLNGQAKKVVRQWLRGMRDGSFTRDGKWTPTANQARALNRMTALLTSTSNGWALRVQNPAVPAQLITAVTLAGVVTIPTHGLTTGKKIRISRTGGIPGLNKIWKVIRLDGDTIQLVAPPLGGFTGGYTKDGTATLQDKVYQAISAANVVRATSHKTGRPFGQSSGRRTTR